MALTFGCQSFFSPPRRWTVCPGCLQRVPMLEKIDAHYQSLAIALLHLYFHRGGYIDEARWNYISTVLEIWFHRARSISP